jgi:hypothetical protein
MKALKKQKSNNIYLAINNTGTDKESVIQNKLNCNHATLARVKDLCDYGTDKCNPVCLNVKCEKLNMLTRTSLPFQRPERSQKSTSAQMPHFQHVSAVPV